MLWLFVTDQDQPNNFLNNYSQKIVENGKPLNKWPRKPLSHPYFMNKYKIWSRIILSSNIGGCGQKRKWCNRCICDWWARLCAVPPPLVFYIDISILSSHSFCGRRKLNSPLLNHLWVGLLVIRKSMKQQARHEHGKIQKTGMKHPPCFFCSPVPIKWKCCSTDCKGKEGRLKTKPTRSYTPCQQTSVVRMRSLLQSVWAEVQPKFPLKHLTVPGHQVLTMGFI